MLILFEFIICLLAAYGLIILVFAAASRLRARDTGKHPGVRVVLLVRNAEEQIEYMIRNAVKYDFTSRVMSDKSLIVVDMDSTDNTALILEKLQKDFSNVEIMKFQDRTLIFDDFPIFSPLIK